MELKTETRMGCEPDAEMFEGKTHLHLGKNHTFNNLADAILQKLTKVEAKCLMIALEKNMEEPKFLKQEVSWQKLVAKVRAERKELNEK